MSRNRATTSSSGEGSRTIRSSARRSKASSRTHSRSTRDAVAPVAPAGSSLPWESGRRRARARGAWQTRPQGEGYDSRVSPTQGGRAGRSPSRPHRQGVRRRRAEPALGGRHHQRAAQEGVPLPGSGHGRVVEEGRRPVDVGDGDGEARRRRPGAGDRQGGPSRPRARLP